MSYYPELDELSLEELIEKWNSPPPEGDEYALVYYEEIVFLILQKYGEELSYGIGVPLSSETLHYFLITSKGKFYDLSIESNEKYNTEKLASVIRFLPLPLEIKKSYLSDQRPLIVASAIDRLAKENAREFRDDILKLRNHEDPYIRSSVLRYMSKLYPDKAKSFLIDALHDPHYVVRENAIDELDDLDARDAIPYIRQLINDEHPDVRQAAEFVLQNMS